MKMMPADAKERRIIFSGWASQCPTRCGTLGFSTILPMNKIIDPLTQFLTAKSVHFRWDEARQVLDLGMVAENARWQCFARQDDAVRFVLVSLLPLSAPAARRNACALLLARINGGLGLGHFEIDFDDGELGYRTVVPVPKKGRLSRDLMEDVLHGHYTIVNRFIPAISAVLFAGLSPERALAVTTEASAGATPQRQFSLN